MHSETERVSVGISNDAVHLLSLTLFNGPQGLEQLLHICMTRCPPLRTLVPRLFPWAIRNVLRTIHRSLTASVRPLRLAVLKGPLLRSQSRSAEVSGVETQPALSEVVPYLLLASRWKKWHLTCLKPTMICSGLELSACNQVPSSSIKGPGIRIDPRCYNKILPYKSLSSLSCSQGDTLEHAVFPHQIACEGSTCDFTGCSKPRQRLGESKSNQGVQST